MNRPRLMYRLLLSALALVTAATLTLAQRPVSLGVKSPSTQPATTYPALDNLPAPHTQKFDPTPAPARGFLVNAGTPGLQLPAPAHKSALTVAILGDLAPTNEASAKYLAQSVRELNLLRPDLVLTVGNLVDGLARNPADYLKQSASTHDALDALKMPWYPCVGPRDILSGTLDPADHRFETLYEKYFGPRYYSLDCGDLHVLVLNTEEQLEPDSKDAPKIAPKNPNAPPRGISPDQAAWVKADLARTFDLRRATSVIIVAHRPLWRDPASSWSRIHDLLVDFNTKPIVTVEGPDNAAASLKRPKVVAVFAGALCAYSHDPTRDGIPYYDLSATAAALDQDASINLRHYTLIHLDAAAAPPQVALVQMAAPPSPAGNILSPDHFLSDEREILARLSALDEKSLSLDGPLDQPVGKDAGVATDDGPMKLLLINPLNVPIDVEVRLASAANLSTPTLHENANPYVEDLDTPWEIFLPYPNRHLEPGAKDQFKCGLFCTAQVSEMPPPQVEFVIHWNDARARTHTVIIKRRIPVIPNAALAVAKSVKLDTDDGWRNAYHGGTYSWTPIPNEPQKRTPDWDMIADETNIYLRVRADDDHQTAWPKLIPPNALPCDAVAISWAPSADTKPADIQRIVALPFAEKDHQLFTNIGVGPDQTALVPLDTKAHPVQLHLARREGNWQLTLALPRATIFPTGQTNCLMNITIHDNDGAAETYVHSWAKDSLALWGRLSLKPPAKETPK